MAIVKSERRGIAIEQLAEARQALFETLQKVDTVQAVLDDLEVSLGLANEGEQAQREQYLVMHYRKGEAVGHTLDECDDAKCADTAADDLIAGLEDEEGEGEEEEGEEEGEEEESEGEEGEGEGEGEAVIPEGEDKISKVE